jgi:NADH dehydrogenase (ubiquinone) 1 alpha subcomplex subunit 2
MSWTRGLANKVRELRFIYCQTSESSQGVREFVSKHYLPVKQANPTLPFIVRECERAIPVVMARYDFGVERKAYVEGLSAGDVEAAVQKLVAQATDINSHRA